MTVHSFTQFSKTLTLCMTKFFWLLLCDWLSFYTECTVFVVTALHEDYEMSHKWNGCGNRKVFWGLTCFLCAEYVNCVTLKITFMWPLTSPFGVFTSARRLTLLGIIKTRIKCVRRFLQSSSKTRSYYKSIYWTWNCTMAWFHCSIKLILKY